MADGGTLTRNAVEDGDDAERARLERKSAGRIHSAFIAVLNEVLPAGTTEANITPELATLRLVGAWGKVRDELVRMLTDAALMGARFAFYYNTGELQANEPTLTSSWDTVNEEVLRYVLGDAFQMGDGYATTITQQLLATSEQQIKETIAAWTRSGSPLSALIHALETTALSRNRAELIATTEVTRAYAEGARLTWAQGGVIQSMRWQTANDDDVCPICRPLNQQVVAVVGGSFAAVDEDGNEIGRVPQPPAHPRCRCWLSPVAPDVAPATPKTQPVAPAVPQVTTLDAERARSLILEMSEQDDTALVQIKQRIDEMTEKLSQNDFTIDDRREIWEKIGSIEREYKTIQQLHDERLRSVLYVDNPASIKVGVSKRIAPEVSKAWADGAETFSRMVDRSLIPDPVTVKVKATKRARGFYSLEEKAINLSTSSSRQRTTVHELGHWLEDANPDIHRKVLDFYDQRTAGEELRWLGGGYDRNEKTRFDKFIHPYMGKDYNRHATEILSMGVENFYTDPVKLAREDPEYFDFIFNLLRGL